MHIVIDLETWGNIPGSDIRSIGACAVDINTGELAIGRFYRNTTNGDYWQLTRQSATEDWWNEPDQADAAKQLLTDQVDLRDALIELSEWFVGMTRHARATTSTDEGTAVPVSQWQGLRLWSHGASYDEPILRVAYHRCGLQHPWHYRSPRDTRTLFEAAGMHPSDCLAMFATGTLHNALDDAICEARAIAAAHRILRSSHDLITHRAAWRRAITNCIADAALNDDDGTESYWNHELTAFDRTFPE